MRACEPLGAKKIIAVVGHQAEKVAAVVEPFEVTTVLQQPQNGTGHALLVSSAPSETRNLWWCCRATRRWCGPKRCAR